MTTDLPPAVLSVRHLRLGFAVGPRTLTAVEDISFDLYPGETLALLGESGCGKSATALALMRLLPAAGRYLGGEINLQGVGNLLALKDPEIRRVRGRRIAMIFQEPATSLNPVLTIGEQIHEVLTTQRGLSGTAAQQEALSLLQQVGIPDPERRLQEYPFQFSGGMKQRAMIAIALAGEPDVLIADEPTTALDVTVQAQILELLRTLQRQRGMAMLLITHDLGVLAQMAHRVGVMYAGQIVELAERHAFFQHSRHPHAGHPVGHPYSQALFAALPESVPKGQRLRALPGQVPSLDALSQACRFADRCIHAETRCHQQAPVWNESLGLRCWLAPRPAPTLPNIASPDVPRKPTPPPLPQQDSLPAEHTHPSLCVEDLQVHFPIRKGLLQRIVGQVRAVDGIHLSLAQGKTLAVVGESGCGKTTVAKALLQLIKPTAGKVLVKQQDWTRLPPDQLRQERRRMQMIFQDPFASLNPRLRVGEILLEGLQAQHLYPNLAAAEGFLCRLLEQVGLNANSLHRFPHEFSGGQRQRIAIARALALAPEILICDEPTSALDVSVQAQILNLLKDLQQELGLAYLFITHNFGVVRYLADEIAVMYLGRIVEQGPADSILETPQHPYTQALLAAIPDLQGNASRQHPELAGELPSPANPPAGCHYHPRCPKATARCQSTYPEIYPLSATSPLHRVACHLTQGASAQ